MRLAAVGEIGLDRYPELGIETVGGCSCNVARAAAAVGAHATLFAAVGTDIAGAIVRSVLDPNVLEIRVRIEVGATAVQPIKIRDGERILEGWQPGVVASYRLTDAELADLATYDAIALAETPAAAQCHARFGTTGPKLIADFSKDAPREWRFDGLAIAFVGGVPGDLDRLRDRDCPLIVLTAGAAGAWAIARDRVVHQPTLATEIIDTTGCGDAFQGAFTAAHFDGATLEDALVAGSWAAAMVAARHGA